MRLVFLAFGALGSLTLFADPDEPPRIEASSAFRASSFSLSLRACLSWAVVGIDGVDTMCAVVWQMEEIGSRLRQQLLDFGLHHMVILAVLGVFSAWVNMLNPPCLVDEEADTGKVTISGIQPPFV